MAWHKNLLNGIWWTYFTWLTPQGTAAARAGKVQESEVGGLRGQVLGLFKVGVDLQAGDEVSRGSLADEKIFDKFDLRKFCCCFGNRFFDRALLQVYCSSSSAHFGRSKLELSRDQKQQQQSHAKWRLNSGSARPVCDQIFYQRF